MFVKNQHSLTLSPQPGINFLLTPCWALRARGERARAADTGALFGRGLRLLTEYRLTWRNAPAPLRRPKAAKPSRHRDLLLEVRGGRGEASGFGEAAATGSWEGPRQGGQGAGRAGGQQRDTHTPSACPGMRLSPSHPSLGNLVPWSAAPASRLSPFPAQPLAPRGSSLSWPVKHIING